MALEIIVALIADRQDPFHRMVPEDEFARPYAERRKIRLAAEETETLATILQRAATGLGLSRPQELAGPLESMAHGRVAFYKPGDEEGFAPRALPRLHWAELVLVDDRGQAVFGIYDQRLWATLQHFFLIWAPLSFMPLLEQEALGGSLLDEGTLDRWVTANVELLEGGLYR